MNKGLIFNFSIEHFLSSQKKKNSEGKSARSCSLLIGLALNELMVHAQKIDNHWYLYLRWWQQSLNQCADSLFNERNESNMASQPVSWKEVEATRGYSQKVKNLGLNKSQSINLCIVLTWCDPTVLHEHDAAGAGVC